MHIYEVLKRPLITEKGNLLAESGQYAFEVDRRANKAQIKQAVEQVFNVTVEQVRVVNVPAKRRRHPRSRIIGRKAKQVVRKGQWRKAFVKVTAGQSIDLFEGV
jgi:large subunit ribosomal protein L23